MTLRPSRLRMAAVGIVAAAALVLSGCAGGGAPSSDTTLRVGLSSEIPGLTPWQSQPYVFTQMAGFSIFDPLIKFDDQGVPQPVLAQSWEVSDDLMTTTLTIRDDAVFHDGSPVTAADVAYSLLLVMDPALIEKYGSAQLVNAQTFGSVEATDDTTVVIKTQLPRRIIDSLRRVFVVPEGSADNPDFGQAPIGSGPFQFASFDSGAELAVTAFADYWDGAPAITELTFVTIPDIGAQASALRSGDIDALYDIKPADFTQVQGAGDFTVNESGRYFSWWMPQTNGGVLGSVEAREAVRYLFDEEQIIASAYNGEGTMTLNPFDETPFGIGQQVDYSYDPAQAKTLFEAAGVLGQTLPIITIDTYEDGSRIAQLLEQAATEAGMVPEIRVVTFDEYVAMTYSDPTWEGLAFGAGTMPFPYRDIFGYMVLNYQPMTDIRSQLGGSSDEKLEELLTQGQELLLSDALVSPSFIVPIRTMFPANLEGVETTSFGDVRWNKAAFTG